MKELQGSLGCSATLKESRLEFQGDVRARIEADFAKRGMKLVRAGG